MAPSHMQTPEGRSLAPSSSAGDWSFTLGPRGAIEWWPARPTPRPDPRLTPRMNETMATYARTGSWKQTAHRLGISIQTCKRYSHQSAVRIEAYGVIETFRELGWLVAP